jgi:hypothetical protein
MNKEIKEQWIKDLRSGKFPQTTGCLVDDKGFCCLGVLSEQARKAGIVTRNGDYYCSVANPLDSSATVLLEAIMTWADLKDELVVLNTGEVLTEINDDHVPFTEIADMIEKDL